jgi:predicted histone-like DNA-binding protein
MATEKIALGINLRQNKNNRNAGFGKFYPVVDQQKTLSLRGFAEHMASHGSLYSRGVVEGVLNQICECLPELVAQGVPVKLGSLGTFYPTAQVEKNAAVGGYDEMEGLNPATIVKGIRIRFRPDSTKLDNICGPKFKDRCALELRNIVDTQSVSLGGVTRKVQTLVPVATAVAEWKARQVLDGNDGTDPDNGDGGNSGSTDSGNGGSTENPVNPDPAAGESFTIAAGVGADGGGSVVIKKNGAAVAGNSVEATGSDTVVLQAVPESDNWQFMSWSDGNSQNPRTIQPSADMNVTANFLDLSKI